MSDCLLALRNEQWKRVRSILTPAFSAAKMKEVRDNALGEQLQNIFLFFSFVQRPFVTITTANYLEFSMITWYDLNN